MYWAYFKTTRIARVILFDKRGTGLSDRMVEYSTLEERMDNIRTVMDTTSSQKAILFGHSEGGCVSALFAATYPNRVISMIAFGYLPSVGILVIIHGYLQISNARKSMI